MKKINKKLAAVLTVIAARSVFFTTETATAKGLELEGIQIIFGRHHDAPPPPPPPPGPHHHFSPGPPPPPPHHHHAWHHGGPRPGSGPQHHGGHMPLPHRH